MEKLIGLILVTLSLVACGGEPFGADSFDAVGGDSGAVAGADTGDAGASDGGTPAAGGSSSVAGKPATAGSSPGGQAHAGSAGSGGTSPVSCEFDESKLTAALPASLIWEDFVFTNGPACVACRDMPCQDVNVISWGVPAAGAAEGEFVFNPNTELPMPSVNLGANDGMCTVEKTCGAKLAGISVTVTVGATARGFAITKAVGSAQFSANQCFPSGGGGETGAMGVDFGKEIGEALQGLEIPCN